MFGTYRTILALMVVLQHLGNQKSLGSFALFSFYILSGYLMTLILNTSYGYDLRGLLGYFSNRFLRIYPAYWFAAIITIYQVLNHNPDMIELFSVRIFLPRDMTEILENVFIFLKYTTRPRLVPPAWALAVELVFYVLMGLGLSRNKKITSLWFIASLGYLVFAIASGRPFEERYYYTRAASVPFSAGAMIFHYKDQILARFKWFSNPSTPFVLFILVILNYNFSKKMGFIEVGFYINLILNLLMVISLLPQTQLNIISPKVDKLIGKWSYPIYLCHFQAGILTKVLFPALKIGTLQMAVYSLPALMLITLIINYVIEAPIEKIRRWIKMRNTSAPHPAGIAKAPAA